MKSWYPNITDVHSVPIHQLADRKIVYNIYIYKNHEERKRDVFWVFPGKELGFKGRETKEIDIGK